MRARFSHLVVQWGKRFCGLGVWGEVGSHPRWQPTRFFQKSRQNADWNTKKMFPLPA